MLDNRGSGWAPIWQWEAIFPGGPDGTVFRDQADSLLDRLTDLASLFDSVGVGGERRPPPQAGELFDQVLSETCDVLAIERVLSLYLAGVCWEHTDDTSASARYAKFQLDVAELRGLMVRLETWAARLVHAGHLTGSEQARRHEHWLSRCVQKLDHRPSSDEAHVDLARSATGRQVWQRLYEDLAGSLPVVIAGTLTTLNEAQQLLSSTSAATRRNTQAALDTGWSRLSVPASACLNAIKGDELRVLRSTRWTSALARSLAHHDIDATAFMAMQNAAGAARTALRDFASVKATALGLTQLAWSDLAAPMPGEERVSWGDAVSMLLSAFSAYSPALGTHAASAIEQGWVHAAPTRAKRPTALCLPLADGASRLMLTFDGSLDSVMSLAHELGHSYHYKMLASCTELQRMSPLPMLELPAMLCEGLLASSPAAPVARTSARSDLHLLNSALIGDFQVMIGAHSRFLFETAVLERRQAGPLSADQLSEAMAIAQDTAYGDCLDRDTVPRQMWISHPHLYTGTLHSWPYMFALLCTHALTAPNGGSAVDPADLDALLARTGRASPARLAYTLGADLSDESFWYRGVDSISTRVRQFAASAAADELEGRHAGGESSWARPVARNDSSLA